MKPIFNLFAYVLLLFSLTNCQKAKLVDQKRVLIGTWTSLPTNLSCGYIPVGGLNPNLKLELFERGKYKLYKGDTKIEAGRLLEIDGYLTFDCLDRDNELKYRKILKFNSDSLNIDRNECGEDYKFRFVKVK